MPFLGPILTGLRRIWLNGTPLPAEPVVNFVSLPAGSSVVDNPTLGTTDVTIVGGSGGTNYQTVQNAGSSETQRTKLNFIGATVADNSGNGSTDVTIPTPAGGLQGVLAVTHSATGTLDSTHQIASCATGGGTIAVNAPVIGGSIGTGWQFAVVDDGGASTTSNITVSGNGVNIEDPNSPGTFASSCVMRMNSGSVVWMYDGTQWKIAYAAYPKALTVFLQTSVSTSITVLSYPLPSGSEVSFKVRFNMRDPVTATNNTEGEYAGAFYNAGAGVVPQTVTGNPSLSNGGIWRTGTGTISFNTAGGGNQVTILCNGGAGVNTNHWRIDVEPILNT